MTRMRPFPDVPQMPIGGLKSALRAIGQVGWATGRPSTGPVVIPARLVFTPLGLHNPAMAAGLTSDDRAIVMRRRDLLVLLGGAAGMLQPLAALAQQKPIPVIGWLSNLSIDTSLLAQG